MITLDAKHIHEVTAEGIRYVNEQDEEQFVDFAVCYENYFKFQTSAEYWERNKEVNNLTDTDWDWHVGRVMKWKEIGRRQPLTPPWADGPYVEFHTNPPIRFKFESKDEYGKLISAILETKWQTFDQS